MSRHLALIRQILEQRISRLRERVGEGNLALVIEDGCTAEELLSLSDLYKVSAPFIVRDTQLGLVGVFKGYGLSDSEEPSEGEHQPDSDERAVANLLDDLRQLAYFYEHRRYAGEERAPTFVLFAVLPETARERLAMTLQQTEQHERLLEAVGLSRLLWLDGIETALGAWGRMEDTDNSETPLTVEVQRFFAPLLLHTRAVASFDRSDLVAEWKRKYQGRILTALPAARHPEAEKGMLTREHLKHIARQQVRHRLEQVFQSVGDREFQPQHPLRLLGLKNLQGIRRFKETIPHIPFGNKMTVLYGHNGSGKSSLLDAVILGLTGEVHRPGEEDKIPENAVAHGGVPSATTPYGELEWEGGQRPLTFGVVSARPVLETFMLSQSSLRRFVGMDGRERYQWMKDHLGLDDGQVSGQVSSLQEELRKLLAGPLKTYASYTLTAKAEIGKPLEKWEQAFQTHLDSVAQQGNLTQLLGGVRNALGRLKQAGLSSSVLSEIENALHAIQEALHTLKSTAHQVQEALKQGESLADPLSKLADAVADVEAALTPLRLPVPPELLQAPRHAPSLPAPNEVVTPEKEAKLRQELEHLEAYIRWADETRAAVAKALDWIDAASTIDALLAALRPQPELVPDTAAPAELPREIDSLRSLAQTVGTHKDFFLKYLQEVESRSAKWKSDRDSKIREYTQASVRDAHWESLMADYKRAVKSVLSRFAITVPDEMDIRSGTEPVAGWGALLDLTHHLALLSKASVATLDEDLKDLMTDYYRRPEGSDWGGLFAQFQAWDTLAKVSQEVGIAVEQTIEEILEQEFGMVFSEIIWTLTGTNWGHLPVRINLRKRKGGTYEAEFETPLNPTDPHSAHPVMHVLNTAELNIVALAFLFTAYLFVGSRWSKTILLDDPFQNLDDINVLGFIRHLDDVTAAVGADQVVVALHQDGIKDYLVSEYSVRERLTPYQGRMQKEEPGFALVEVYQTSDRESKVRVYTGHYRMTPHSRPPQDRAQGCQIA